MHEQPQPRRLSTVKGPSWERDAPKEAAQAAASKLKRIDAAPAPRRAMARHDTIRKYFEHSGALLTADGTLDEKLEFEGRTKGETFTLRTTRCATRRPGDAPAGLVRLLNTMPRRAAGRRAAAGCRAAGRRAALLALANKKMAKRRSAASANLAALNLCF